MTAGLLLWIAGTMSAFIIATSLLRTYIGNSWTPLLIIALVIYTIGNLMMVRLMRETGLGGAVALSSILQLVIMTAIAYFWFGERPAPIQTAGIVLGVVAVGLILWRGGSPA